MNASQHPRRCNAAPAAYMTRIEAVEHATMRVIETQSRLIARLVEECAELRRELGR